MTAPSEKMLLVMGAEKIGRHVPSSLYFQPSVLLQSESKLVVGVLEAQAGAKVCKAQVALVHLGGHEINDAACVETQNERM